MTDETKMIDVLIGPYRAKRLKVSAADAQSAVNNHWATDPDAAPDDHPHPPLSEEERTAAMKAANDWAQAQWDEAQGVSTDEPPPPDPDEGVATRDMEADESGSYSTRSGKKRR